MSGGRVLSQQLLTFIDYLMVIVNRCFNITHTHIHAHTHTITHTHLHTHTYTHTWGLPHILQSDIFSVYIEYKMLVQRELYLCNINRLATPEEVHLIWIS